MKYSFAPLINKNSKILVLGSLPGQESLMQQKYYAYKYNQFWRIMFDILGYEPTNDYDKKCQMLLDNNIALWDTVKSANRKGSLDSNIKDITTNEIHHLLKEYQNIQKILLNGKKAESLYKKMAKDIDIISISLPSTSPAHASMKYEEKLELWKKAVCE